MQPTDHTLKLTRQRRPGVALLAVLFALALEPQGGGRAEAALATVGPVDPATGFPVDYADGNGRALQICLDAGVCTAPLPNPNLPPSVPSNFPDETFYWSGGATMTTNANGTALLFMAVEAAFGNGVATAGQQITFARIRVRVDNLVAGQTYTVTHPFGRDSFVAQATVDRRRMINSTRQVGCAAGAPCDFTIAVGGRIGPFLTWDVTLPAPPAGYVGNPFINHKVTGSPFGTNFFAIDGPNVGGPGVNHIQTDLFAVQGKLFAAAPPAPAFTMTPTTLDFGNQKVNTTGTARSISVSNGGTANLSVQSVVTAGTNAVEFSRVNDTCSGAVLAPGASCAVAVVFRPRATGNRTASLVFTDNAAGSPHAVAISGVGAVPMASLSPTAIDFGNARLLTATAAQPITVTNTGVVTLVVSTVTLAGTNPQDFIIAADGCTGANVPAGGSCTVTVKFQPRFLGARTATLQVTSDAPGSPHTASMRGNGSLL